jgi:CheY-like chemotaxis protein
MRQIHFAADAETTPPPPIECPRCHGFKAILAYDRYSVQSFFCPECEYDWCNPPDLEESRGQAAVSHRLWLTGARLRASDGALAPHDQWRAATMTMTVVGGDNRPTPKGIRHVGLSIGTVLVVEDDTDLREMIQVLLEDAGYAALGAANGREALESMGHRRPGLVLLDINMPVMDGWEFRRRQIADSRLSGIPVICVTADYNPLEVTEQLKVRCIAKPFGFDELLGAVASACRRAD